jgi:hypothetical protein
MQLHYSYYFKYVHWKTIMYYEMIYSVSNLKNLHTLRNFSLLMHFPVLCFNYKLWQVFSKIQKQCIWAKSLTWEKIKRREVGSSGGVRKDEWGYNNKKAKPIFGEDKSCDCAASDHFLYLVLSLPFYRHITYNTTWMLPNALWPILLNSAL